MNEHIWNDANRAKVKRDIEACPVSDDARLCDLLWLDQLLNIDEIIDTYPADETIAIIEGLYEYQGRMMPAALAEALA